MTTKNNNHDSCDFTENPKNARVVTFERDASKEKKPAPSQQSNHQPGIRPKK
ncbi:MAG: hypothetical protein ACMZI0_20365 [Symbiopectobacterium sp.]|uniref:hypothetical protein n=1 Tax=Symbiopectobacterium sp. TaxID=2952789 RepID=UPI0039ECB249